MLKKLFGRKSSAPADKASTDSSSRSSSSSTGNHSAAAKNNTSNKKPRPKASSHKRSENKNTQGTQQRRDHHAQANKKVIPSEPWDLSKFQVAEQKGKTRFHDLGLHLELMHAISDLGYEYCSPIQAQSLPYTLNGQDIVGKAQTGTGKTAAFLTSIIDDLLRNPIEGDRFAGEARALIIAPTRELVIQIAEDAKGLTKYADLNVHALVGGMDYEKQRRNMEQNFCDILVATPGRLLDFVQRRDVYLDQVEVLVLDEADRMLDMGFIPQVRKIVSHCPDCDHRQTQFFSATFTQEVEHLVSRWTQKSIRVEITPERVATDTVEQSVFYVAGDEKFDLLYNIAKLDEVDSLILFANRRDECRILHYKLEKLGFKVGILSGEVAQNKRVSTLEGFKTGKLNILVATDVAGRGIHIDGISHVVNYNLPEEAEDYVHRIGRTGRAGKKGVSFSFACEDDSFRLPAIEKMLGSKLKAQQPPLELVSPSPRVDVPREVRRGPSDNKRSGSGGNRPGGGHRSGGSRPRR